MTLRRDEEFVKNCLAETLCATNAWEGENPPDIYLEIDGKKIAVEITRLSPVSFCENGSIKNRNSQDYFGVALCNKLNSNLKNQIPSNVDIHLILYVPVENARKYKKRLAAYLKEFISKGIKAGYKETMELSGSKVEICVIPNRQYSNKKIVGAIVNTNSNADILYNAHTILAERIRDKVKKCQIINHEEPIWLALLNDYFLADHETYMQALQAINIAHNFARIYVIMGDHSVHQVYPS